jgi:hypothetical protein
VNQVNPEWAWIPTVTVLASKLPARPMVTSVGVGIAIDVELLKTDPDSDADTDF